MKSVVLDYNPTAKQRLFHESTADEVLYGGAAGGGKSFAICWDAFLRCLQWPRTHAYLFRRTYPELEMTLIKTMLTIVPRSWGHTMPACMKCGLSTEALHTFVICRTKAKA